MLQPNTTQTIPGPLLDRMEIIEITSYTKNEKLHIAKNFLVKKQLERNGLTKEQVMISDKALEKVIHNYTREAGVRSLEHRIGFVPEGYQRVLENKKKGYPDYRIQPGKISGQRTDFLCRRQ